MGSRVLLARVKTRGERMAGDAQAGPLRSYHAPCSGTSNDSMPAAANVGGGTVRRRAYQDAAPPINNPKEGATVQGGTPLSCLGSYEHAVIVIDIK